MKHLSRTAVQFICAMLLTTLSVAAIADIYVSRDASGKLIYSDREPSGPHERVRVDARPGSPAPAASTPADERAKWLQADKGREERTQQAEKQRIAAAEERVKRCADARRENAIYGVDGRKCNYDAAGNRSCLSTAEIDAKRAEAKRLMAANCTAPAGL